MNLGEKIRNARTAKNMSQKDLAAASGVSLRSIQYYEDGTKVPRSRSTYTKLAQSLGVDETFLMDSNVEFVLLVGEKYGSKAATQAMALASEVSGMFAGGELEEEDMDEIMKAIQDAYWDAKKNNRKYVNKRYRKDDSE